VLSPHKSPVLRAADASRSVDASASASRTAKVFALSAGSGLSVLASVVASMVAARYLSKADYATVRQTFLAYDVAAPLLMLGLPNALYYFLPREESDKRGVIIDNIALLSAAAVVFCIFIAAGGSQLLMRRFSNPMLLQTLPWLAAYPLLLMPTAGLSAVLVSAGRARVHAVYSLSFSLALALFGVLATIGTQSFRAPVLVRILVPAAFLPVAILLMFGTYSGKVRMPRLQSMGAMLRYSVPLGFASMLGSLTLQLHSVIVAAMTSPQEFAIYINGAMEIPLIGVVTGSITTVVLADMSALCARGEKVQALRLFHIASIRSAGILFPVMCYLLVVAKPFILVLYSAAYTESFWPFMLYLLVLPVRVVMYGAALMALGMTRAVLVRSVADLCVNALLCVILVRMLGYLGAAVATLITLYLWTIPFNLVAIARGFGVRWWQTLPLGQLARLLAASAALSPLAVLGAHALALPPLARLVLAAAFYFPPVLLSTSRLSLMPLPPQLQKWLPSVGNLSP
jgi:O-antigen/teichoic acid export membrane protein